MTSFIVVIVASIADDYVDFFVVDFEFFREVRHNVKISSTSHVAEYM